MFGGTTLFNVIEEDEARLCSYGRIICFEGFQSM